MRVTIQWRVAGWVKLIEAGVITKGSGLEEVGKGDWRAPVVRVLAGRGRFRLSALRTGTIL